MRPAPREAWTLGFRVLALAVTMWGMIGTALNVAGIVVGGIVGLVRPKPLPPARESFLKVGLGAFTVFYGLRLVWLSLNGSLGQIVKQLLIAVLALMLGKLAGRMLRLQSMSNHIGREARAALQRLNRAPRAN